MSAPRCKRRTVLYTRSARLTGAHTHLSDANLARPRMNRGRNGSERRGLARLSTRASGVRTRHRAIHGITQRLLARVIDQIEVQLVHHVRVADVRVGVGERERAARAGMTKRSRTRSESNVGPRSQIAERI